MTLTDTFRDLHHRDEVLLMPNPWDAGSAKVMESLGFAALATTSSGAAATLGLDDGALGRDRALRGAAEIVAAVDVPVSADLENGFADDPTGVADTFRRAVDVGLAGASIEDWDGSAIYERRHAVERVRAAVEAADGRLVVTARAENHIHGVDDFEDTLGRVQDYAAAGADVVFAPGLATADQIGALVRGVDVPVSVLAVPGVPSVPELRDLGVRRVSTGGSWAWVAYAAMAEAGRELLEQGTFGYLDGAAEDRAVVDRALG
ncbi:isocitrate lyase/phosphoenolpyruvate mutase family protein [Spiractinospora alimapuensis]|uniref:isocitrate lyase/PEP mutase family protein n=1 Tax=Spiractinospora alimapuensis TaxID=2820884 RepID=UPI001F32BE85|nr:isocitrate lyase/phosphoenolpyruvate mutase family protein [Spiractinospora alimapuensis]QVQ54518.1 isocitrate lyase/phosphoenolpyruvate mutase family protein [Spiractinospora alimapuensis]